MLINFANRQSTVFKYRIIYYFSVIIHYFQKNNPVKTQKIQL